jgi:hypothetical protein
MIHTCLSNFTRIATKTNMWDATIGDFKYIYDYNVKIGHNAYY